MAYGIAPVAPGRSLTRDGSCSHGGIPSLLPNPTSVVARRKIWRNGFLQTPKRREGSIPFPVLSHSKASFSWCWPAEFNVIAPAAQIGAPTEYKSSERNCPRYLESVQVLQQRIQGVADGFSSGASSGPFLISRWSSTSRLTTARNSGLPNDGCSAIRARMRALISGFHFHHRTRHRTWLPSSCVR